MPQESSPRASKSQRRRHNVERSNRRSAAQILLQIGLGLLFVGIWAFANNYIYGDNIASLAATGLPIFGAYVAGVLSRYVPGLRQFARRLE